MEKLVSIIVPIYGVEKYLARGIDSVLEQTYEKIEVILIDDGSPDNCGKICDAYALQDQRIQVIHQKNQGLCIARNSGLKKAKGKYVYFFDPDDYLEKNIIEELVKGIKSNSCDLSICNYFIDKKNKKSVKMNLETKVYDKTEIFDKILKKNFFCGYVWNKLYKMDIIQKNNLYFDSNVTMLEDLLFSCKYLTFCKNNIFYNNTPMYNYFIREDSIINEKKFDLKKLKVYEALEQLFSLYENVSPTNVIDLKERYIKITYTYVYSLKQNKIDLNVLHEEIRRSKKYRKELFAMDISLKKKIEILFISTLPTLYGKLRQYIRKE